MAARHGRARASGSGSRRPTSPLRSRSTAATCCRRTGRPNGRSSGASTSGARRSRRRRSSPRTRSPRATSSRPSASAGAASSSIDSTIRCGACSSRRATRRVTRARRAAIGASTPRSWRASASARSWQRPPPSAGSCVRLRSDATTGPSIGGGRRARRGSFRTSCRTAGPGCSACCSSGRSVAGRPRPRASGLPHLRQNRRVGLLAVPQFSQIRIARGRQAPPARAVAPERRRPLGASASSSAPPRVGHRIRPRAPHQAGVAVAVDARRGGAVGLARRPDRGGSLRLASGPSRLDPRQPRDSWSAAACSASSPLACSACSAADALGFDVRSASSPSLARSATRSASACSAGQAFRFCLDPLSAARPQAAPPRGLRSVCSASSPFRCDRSSTSACSAASRSASAGSAARRSASACSAASRSASTRSAASRSPRPAPPRVAPPRPLRRERSASAAPPRAARPRPPPPRVAPPRLLRRESLRLGFLGIGLLGRSPLRLGLLEPPAAPLRPSPLQPAPPRPARCNPLRLDPFRFGLRGGDALGLRFLRGLPFGIGLLSRELFSRGLRGLRVSPSREVPAYGQLWPGFGASVGALGRSDLSATSFLTS